jgi:hypothetical protein
MHHDRECCCFKLTMRLMVRVAPVMVTVGIFQKTFCTLSSLHTLKHMYIEKIPKHSLQNVFWNIPTVTITGATRTIKRMVSLKQQHS